MIREASGIELVAPARGYGERTAIFDTRGAHSYGELLDASARVAAGLLKACSTADLQEQRVAFLAAPGFAWVAMQWGIWRAGGIAVPLPVGAARPELEYILEDTGASMLCFDDAAAFQLASIAGALGIRGISFDELIATEPAALPEVASGRRAMILYTSGTTSKPKGVVTTHANIAAQITSLLEAWEWSANDRIILCLPLHHVHGIINVLSCALWTGAMCEMLPRFDAAAVWGRIASGEVTLFMAVPTIYARLIAAWEAAAPELQEAWTRGCAEVRLMVSGSAALPVSTLERWREISGHTLLERYGMTEIGMALSNPYRGERIPGCVGSPLPGVEVRLVGEDGAPVPVGLAGEIEVRGPGVFAEYWGKLEATREAFRDGFPEGGLGWFRTGDTAVEEDGVYRILGRTSIDILKSGGHKISALEIEEVLRTHPDILECAVVGVPDAEWGERVAAALVLRADCTLELASLREWGREMLAVHKLPSRLLVVEALPRNAMGKVVKPQVTRMFANEAE